MRRKRPLYDDRIVDIAAAAYRLDAECANPAPDLLYRNLLRSQLSRLISALPYELRVELSRWEVSP